MYICIEKERLSLHIHAYIYTYICVTIYKNTYIYIYIFKGLTPVRLPLTRMPYIHVRVRMGRKQSSTLMIMSQNE